MLSFNYSLYPNDSPVISAYDRGFALGDGLFETIKVTHYKPELWEAHMERMAYGCRILQITMPPNLYETALDFIHKNQQENGILKITLSRESPIRGLMFHKNAQINILMTFSDMPAISTSIKACISDIRRNETSPLSQVKSLNYGDNLLAYNQALSMGYDDALMLNTKGQPCCFTIGNILIQTQDGMLVSPPVETGCLRGTFLSTLKDIQYRTFTLNEAVTIWRTNSVSGMVEVTMNI